MSLLVDVEATEESARQAQRTLDNEVVSLRQQTRLAELGLGAARTLELWVNARDRSRGEGRWPMEATHSRRREFRDVLRRYGAAVAEGTTRTAGEQQRAWDDVLSTARSLVHQALDCPYSERVGDRVGLIWVPKFESTGTAEQPALEGSVRLEATPQLPPGQQRFTVTEVKVRIDAEGDLSAEPAEITETAAGWLTTRLGMDLAMFPEIEGADIDEPDIDVGLGL